MVTKWSVHLNFLVFRSLKSFLSMVKKKFPVKNEEVFLNYGFLHIQIM